MSWWKHISGYSSTHRQQSIKKTQQSGFMSMFSMEKYLHKYIIYIYMKVVYLWSISKPKTVNIYMQNIFFYYNFSVLYLLWINSYLIKLLIFSYYKSTYYVFCINVLYFLSLFYQKRNFWGTKHFWDTYILEFWYVFSHLASNL